MGCGWVLGITLNEWGLPYWLKPLGVSVGILLMGLNVCPEDKLPFLEYEGVDDVEPFILACDERYTGQGRRLHGMPRDKLLAGYYQQNGTSITCTLDRKAEPTAIAFDGATSVDIEDPFVACTEVSVVKDGRTMTFGSLAVEFDGMPFPVSGDTFLMSLTRRGKPAKKARTSEGSGAQPVGALGVVKSGVSAAIQNRLKDLDEKK